MAGGSDAGGSEAPGAASVVSVLLVVARNRELRGVELAYATFNIGEWAA